jgi:uncharacterized membrane protein YjfL (UPF0719 family)
MKRFIAFLSTLTLPVVAFAQSTGGVLDLLAKFAEILRKLFPIAVALAVLGLFYEIIMFIIHQNDDKGEKFKKGIAWSLLALVVMLTFFGGVRLIATTLGLEGTIGADLNASDIPVVNI